MSTQVWLVKYIIPIRIRGNYEQAGAFSGMEAGEKVPVLLATLCQRGENRVH